MDEHDKPTTLHYWLALGLAALAVRIVVACLLFCGMPDASDPRAYADQARQMVEGTSPPQPFYYPPGRSYALVPFFRVFGTSNAVVQANSIFIDVACVLAAAVLAHQVLRRRSAARLSGWVAAFYPPAIMLSGFSYTMNVVMLTMLCSTCLALLAGRCWPRPDLRLTGSGGAGEELFLRWRFRLVWLSLGAWFLSGVFLGFAVLTRPSTASVVFVPAAWFSLLLVRLIKPKLLGEATRISPSATIAAGAAFLIGLAGCVAPVLKRQHDLGAGWSIATATEAVFYGNNPYTPHYKTWHLVALKAGSPEYKAYLTTLTSQADPRDAMLHEAKRYILARPDIFLLRTVNRIRAFWGFDYLASANVQQAHWGGRAALGLCLAAEAGGYCLTMLLVLAGLFLWQRAMTGGHAALLVGLTMAYQLPYAFIVACGSYRFPVMGFLFPFAGFVLDEIFRGGSDFWRSLRAMRWFWVFVAIFVAIQLEYTYFLFSYYGGVAS